MMTKNAGAALPVTERDNRGLILRPAQIRTDGFLRAMVTREVGSYAALAKAAKVAPYQISRLFNGEAMSLLSLAKIAKALQMKWPDEALDLDEERARPERQEQAS